MPQFPGIASVHVSNQRCDENVAKNCTKLPWIRRQWTVHCTQKPSLSVTARIMQIYMQLSRSVKYLFQSFSKLSTVIDSTNQILIPGAGITERRHQWNVHGMSTGSPVDSLVTRPLSARPAHPLYDCSYVLWADMSSDVMWYTEPIISCVLSNNTQHKTGN